jgi:hypothetical protein
VGADRGESSFCRSVVTNHDRDRLHATLTGRPEDDIAIIEQRERQRAPCRGPHL